MDNNQNYQGDGTQNYAYNANQNYAANNAQVNNAQTYGAVTPGNYQGYTAQNAAANTQYYSGNVNPNVPYVSTTGASSFIEADEVPLISLKNGYAMNLISGESWKNEDAVITNKRLYYSHKVGLINRNSTEEIVDLKDVTGSKIALFNPWALIVLAVIAFVAFIICLASDAEGAVSAMCLIWSAILVIMFFVIRKAYLRIEYAGGNIHFSVKKYSLEVVREFQRVIYSARK